MRRAARIRSWFRKYFTVDSLPRVIGISRDRATSWTDARARGFSRREQQVSYSSYFSRREYIRIYTCPAGGASWNLVGSKTFGVYLAKWRHPSWKWPGRYYACHREENANCRIFICDAVREWFACRLEFLRPLSSLFLEYRVLPDHRTAKHLSHRIFPLTVVKRNFFLLETKQGRFDR